MSHRFARAGWPRQASIAATATVTASATPHTVGAYAQILASTAFEVCAMMLRGFSSVSQTGVDTSMLLTIATGAAASEVDIISNLAYGGFGGGNPIWLPIYIPAGLRVSAKLQAEQVSDTFDAQVVFLYKPQMPGWGGYSTCETFGADTPNSRGTPISDTPGTYTQITAATTTPLRALNITCGLVSGTASAATPVVVDVGVGGAGAEQIVGTWHYDTATSESVILRAGPPYLVVPIPAGSRIAMKKDNAAPLSGVVMGWR